MHELSARRRTLLPSLGWVQPGMLGCRMRKALLRSQLHHRRLYNAQMLQTISQQCVWCKDLAESCSKAPVQLTYCSCTADTADTGLQCR